MSLAAQLAVPQWFPLFVRSNQEKRVARHLDYRNIEYFLPSYQAIHQWKDRRINIVQPLFPGYVFVRICYVNRLNVLSIPNVVSIVGTKSFPSIISETEISWIRHGVEHGNAQPCPQLAIGSRVVITFGALAGMQGILVRRQGIMRVCVSIESISRAFLVEVDAGCIEAASLQSLATTMGAFGPKEHFLESIFQTPPTAVATATMIGPTIQAHASRNIPSDTTGRAADGLN